MALKSLNDTYIYQHLNRNGNINKAVGEIYQNGKVLNGDQLAEAFLIINKNFKYPLKHKIMDALSKGEIVLMYAPQNVKLPTSMPFFLTKRNDGKIISVVSVDLYGNMDKDNGHVNIDAKKLYCLMESAYMAKICFMADRLLTSRNIVITSGSSIYSNMFIRVLNKQFSLNVDKSKMHKVLFLASKFYLMNILGLPDDQMTFNYAIKNCVNGNPILLKEVSDAFGAEEMKDLSTFIQALGSKDELRLGLKGLTVRGYLEGFINMYDASALLALESFPYFLYNVISVTNGAYINNQYVLEDIVGTHGGKLYADIVTLDR